jgi:FkbM family methyltransferase
MATIAINHNPPMTRYLVEKTDVFHNDPVTIVDVGARWGFNPEWSAFGKCLRVYCFEPDEKECRRLNAFTEDNVKYIPYAVGRTEGEATFYETKLSASSGLYKADMVYLSRLTGGDNCAVAAQRPVKLQTLAAALQNHGVRAIDFIKLDVEGAELDVLMGGETYLKNGLLLGILSEVRFQEEINGCPIYWQLDEYVRRFGFRLYDLQFYHQSRRALPYPGLWDYRTSAGERIYAYTTQGQIMDGDALYFRDLLIPANHNYQPPATVPQVLKLAAFFEIYCLNDCAAELILAHQDQLEGKVDCRALLELLTPEMDGKKMGYDAYLKRYFDRQGGVFADAPQSTVAPTGKAYASMEKEQLLAELTRIIAQLQIQLRKNEQVGGELARVYGSNSWRVTKPLRALSTLFKKKPADPA